MPCSDVTETVRVTLDDGDRLQGYCFVKRACGRPVGRPGLLLEALQGRRLEEILAETPASFLAAHPAGEGAEEFLVLKHLLAVQAALEVLTGHTPGGPGEPCRAAEIVYDTDAITIEADLSLALMTDRIEACGGCGGCGVEPGEV